MRDFLVVVDMQNDFIDGALGTAEAVKIVPDVVERIKLFKGQVVYTRDTHQENYLETQEGRLLPVPHCIWGTEGWKIRKEVEDAAGEKVIIDKPSFGSVSLGEYLQRENGKEAIGSVTLLGLCTDICVISNALVVKAFLPEVPVIVDAACSAGATPEGHEDALKALERCQVRIIR